MTTELDKYVVTDEQDKKFQNKLWELETRWRKKILDPRDTLRGLQVLIEDRLSLREADLLSLADWQSFYHSVGIGCDLSDVVIPKNPGGFDRVIIVAKGITPQSAFNLCVKNFPCWKNMDEDLDGRVVSDRSSEKGHYAIRVRDNIESDEEYKRCSRNIMEKRGVKGITLVEREILELKFFKETNRHLDMKSSTLCTGCGYSYFDGNIPIAGWKNNEFGIDYVSRDYMLNDLRARQVIC